MNICLPYSQIWLSRASGQSLVWSPDCAASSSSRPSSPNTAHCSPRSFLVSRPFQPECNTYACRYDGLECSYGAAPYQNCSAIARGVHCFELFHDGRCDAACASEACLYDGFDCAPPAKECTPLYDAYCANHYANGHCDEG